MTPGRLAVVVLHLTFVAIGMPLKKGHCCTGMYVRGEGRFPHLEAWFDAMEKRPAYLGSRSDFYTHCHDLPPQLGGQTPYLEALLGISRCSAQIHGSARSMQKLACCILSILIHEFILARGSLDRCVSRVQHQCKSAGQSYFHPAWACWDT